MWSYFLCLGVAISATFFIQILALTVTQPESGTVWHLHSSNVVAWKSVETDPESIAVKIVNNNPSTYPTGYSQELKDGINTVDNKFAVDSLPGVKPGKGYQVNIMSSAGTILAQSAQFTINGTTETPTTPQTHLNAPVGVQPTLSVSAPSATASASDAMVVRASPTALMLMICLLVGGLNLM
ncbi:hypothetical protein CROQUDRAFT_651988 [Cronartium quercuum f. sp. fusiforme G11]|uniref:Yeast cell wall synthesis Kre9/Knh1-like N-terminal domain-containing protein n=1 Tax=Cronartium quercuum f. sp. fusiforme G11 TaxID=708437 RepID=A0A9P6NWK2_9BASI|nr:hypothetical protein CROQUDRAFT_651988 [Cronartium quercuum f. sp. fusiforme G11]